MVPMYQITSGDSIMPRRKLDSFPPPDLSTMAGRIAWLLIHLFGGNMRRMAEAVGVTHSVLSKVVGEQQGPGRRLMESIASHPKVNPDWLFSGEGEPLLAARHPGSGEIWEAPIAHILLSGPPTEQAGLFEATTFPLAGAFYRPTRYLYRAGAGDPIVRMDSEKVAPGDLLLLETEDGLWKADRRILAGALVAIRVVSRDGFDYVLARVGTDFRPVGMPLSPFMRVDASTSESKGDQFEHLLKQGDVRTGRMIEPSDDEDAQSSPRPTASGPTDQDQAQERERAESSDRTPVARSASPPVGPDRTFAAQVNLVDAVIALCVMLIRR